MGNAARKEAFNEVGDRHKRLKQLLKTVTIAVLSARLYFAVFYRSKTAQDKAG